MYSENLKEYLIENIALESTIKTDTYKSLAPSNYTVISGVIPTLNTIANTVSNIDKEKLKKSDFKELSNSAVDLTRRMQIIQESPLYKATAIRDANDNNNLETIQRIIHKNGKVLSNDIQLNSVLNNIKSAVNSIDINKINSNYNQTHIITNKDDLLQFFHKIGPEFLDILKNITKLINRYK